MFSINRMGQVGSHLGVSWSSEENHPHVVYVTWRVARQSVRLPERAGDASRFSCIRHSRASRFCEHLSGALFLRSVAYCIDLRLVDR